ncbi:lipase family protein [Aquabacterium lacunae]|nr:lipase family protein [Aquabacterium lacunae]
MNTRKIATAFRVLPLAAIAMAASAAFAAPVQGPADASFYTYPAALPAANGELISYRDAQVNLGANAPAAKAWNVVYKSSDSKDAAVAIAGTVIVPTAAWTGTGPRPILSYAVGTHGLDPKCAPSKQLAAGTDYEAANIAAALKAGYAVMVTDYKGALTGTGSATKLGSTYLSGKAQGNAVLDIVRAAAQIPGANLSLNSQVAIWGFSQGGQSATWAAEQLANGYAPELKVVGVAAGGVPGNLREVAPTLDGNIGFAFLGAALNGLNNQYPGTLPIRLLASEEGLAALNKINTQCVFEALFEFQNKSLPAYTRDNIPLDELLEIGAPTLDQQNLGNVKINVPMYIYHGKADEFIPVSQGVNLKNAYCAKGTSVTFDLFPSEHIVTQFQAAATALPWLNERLAGKAPVSSCNSTKPAPVSTANPGGGNFVVTLDKWNLAGEIGLKTLAQTVFLPAGSTFSADADVTAKTLNGSLSIPDYKTTVKLIGINTSVGLRVEAAGATTGSNVVGNDGSLTITGQSPANITVTSVLGIPFGQCKTVSPVIFPLNLKGNVGTLGDGTLNFTGTTSFPQIKGCFISGILTALMSGNGQTFKLNVAPPAPIRY